MHSPHGSPLSKHHKEKPMATKNEQSEQAEPNTLKDRWGNERPYDPELYPEGSAAREGKVTGPSGQGGATPKARPDHQDMFPPNPEPSAHAKDWGERLERAEQGEDVDFTTPAGTSAKAAPAAKKDDTK
jgi:hypothetical protein